MNEYELKIYSEVEDWKRRLRSRSGILTRLSKSAQEKINSWIPEKLHKVVTDSIKAMVKTTLFGSQLTVAKYRGGPSLFDRDEEARRKIAAYQKAAIIEGAGTGAGGLLIGLADFPLLLTIKMKFLFDVAAVYGFDPKEYEERLFILHVFQLAFSSGQLRKNTLAVIEDWEERKSELVDMDWRKLQQEYRDYIDLAKLLQLVPGIGAVVGAYANNNLLKHLGETAMNCYRLRILSKTPEH